MNSPGDIVCECFLRYLRVSCHLWLKQHYLFKQLIVELTTSSFVLDYVRVEEGYLVPRSKKFCHSCIYLLITTLVCMITTSGSSMLL